MKKIAITGIILVLVMMFATCDTPAVGEVEYTDVVYAPDGSKVTLFLDGVGVPVTPAQRAINKELATMAYDYFEVIFIGPTNGAADITRNSWELGQPAGIANVPRKLQSTDADNVGIDYAFAAGKATGATMVNIACMFVGKKSDKTLLGIGFINGTSYTTAPVANPTTTITRFTSSVTFEIAAIQTGLLVGPIGAGATETIDDGGSATTLVSGVRVDSFKYTAATGVTGSVSYTARNANNSVRSTVNGSPLKYPRYSLPQNDGATVSATYEFTHIGRTATTKDYFTFAKVINSDVAISATAPFRDRPLAQKRVPRFMNGGRYMEPKEGWTTTTSVNITGALAPAANGAAGSSNDSAFSPLVPLLFTIKGSGIFSFYLQIPVYMISSTTGTFEGNNVAPIKWYIRTGVGSELYSLDDGIANGGCVFMSVGASAANWLDIDWVWVN